MGRTDGQSKDVSSVANTAESMDGTVRTYEAVAERYRERHGDRRPIAGQIEAFDEAVDGAGDRPRVLDVGCGPGWETATLCDLGYDVVGVDLTPAFLSQAREEAPSADLARMDMRRLGFAAESVDGVWALASFLHVPRADAPATLAGFERVLRPGGVLYLSVKRGTGTRRGDGYPEDARQFTLYRASELRELVVGAGFTVESVADGDWVQVLART